MIQRGMSYLTKDGRDLLAFCQTGAQLNFSRAAVGDGEIKSTEQINSMEKLVHEVLEITFKGVKANGDGTSRIALSVDNESVSEGFLMRELGIFANDPRKGEILYSVIPYTEFPDFIASSRQEITEIFIDVDVIVSNVESITINIDRSTVYATQLELEDLAGVGRTNQTVKGNWDLIRDLELKVLMLSTEGGGGGVTPSGNMFKVSFPLSEEEEWSGIYDAENARLVI